MSQKVKIIVMVVDFDHAGLMGSAATQGVIEGDRLDVAQEQVAFLAADCYAKAEKARQGYVIRNTGKGADQTTPKDGEEDTST